MKFHVLTLFPELIEGTFATSITGRALEKGQISLHAVNIRDYADNKHQKVDDYPYGGGAGMVMQAEPVYRACEELKKKLTKEPRVIYVTPQGRVFDQELARELSREEELVFLCGHYEGIDERVLEEVVTDYVSIGDYVLTGGELPALVMMDAISRLVPGVLNNDDSAEFESFHGSLLEYPQYSRPEIWHGKAVPKELMSGNHKTISAWRLERSIERTRERRPDLYQEYERRAACEKQLLQNKLLHMDMLESLRLDKGKIRYFAENGVLLVDDQEGIAYVTVNDLEAGKAVLEPLAVCRKGRGQGRTAVDTLVLHQKFLVQAAKELLTVDGQPVFAEEHSYEQWVYTLKNPLPLPREGWEEEKARETLWINSLVQQGRTPYLWVAKEDAAGQELQQSLGLYPAKTPIWVLKRLK
ncbi:MAG: tRNA (guanosine(37)-N1)-methyltransferase TrmD [Lachnospiraceae bacterium]|nr:tRNA (guanosine(37)-N1)-methyltransferase TrmD [Lachnospiraceae bacterium]